METPHPADEAPPEQGDASGHHGLFDAGRIVATPEAWRTLKGVGMTPDALLARHLRGDWGDLDEHDKQENERALQQGKRLLSGYDLLRGIRVYIITEADRSLTTLLMSDEY